MFERGKNIIFGRGEGINIIFGQNIDLYEWVSNELGNMLVEREMID